MLLLQLGQLDVSSWLEENGLTVAKNILVSEKSGRNARGDNRVEIVNRKIKLTARFRPLTAGQIAEFLTAIDPYVLPVTYRDPKTGGEKTITVYTGTPTVAYRQVNRADFAKSMLEEFELSFIEM